MTNPVPLTEQEQLTLDSIKRELAILSSYHKTVEKELKLTKDRIDKLISKKWKLEEKKVGITLIKRKTRTVKSPSKKQQPLDPIILEELKRRGLIE